LAGGLLTAGGDRVEYPTLCSQNHKSPVSNFSHSRESEMWRLVRTSVVTSLLIRHVMLGLRQRTKSVQKSRQTRPIFMGNGDKF